jgi:hypothetical protein
MKKLRAVGTQGMPSTIWSIIFSLPVCYPKIYILKFTELQFFGSET